MFFKINGEACLSVSRATPLCSSLPEVLEDKCNCIIVL
nr:MAG TPA: hypothetical protein [Caudoviricetes sp.]